MARTISLPRRRPRRRIPESTRATTHEIATAAVAMGKEMENITPAYTAATMPSPAAVTQASATRAATRVSSVRSLIVRPNASFSARSRSVFRKLWKAWSRKLRIRANSTRLV